MTRFADWAGFHPVLGTKRRYKVTVSCDWDIGRKGSGWTLKLPVGFTFDVSTPRGLGWLVNPHNRDLLASAAIHDILLEQGHDATFAASEMRRAMRARGLSSFKAWAIYFAAFFYTAFLKSDHVG